MSNGEVSVEVLDTSLRDGAQALPDLQQFPYGSKPKIAREIARLGVGVIEAGFPETPGDEEEVRKVAETVGQEEFIVRSWNSGNEIAPISYTPVIAGLSRATESDIESVWRAVAPAKRPRIHTFISTDEYHMAAKFPGKSPKEVLEMGIRAVRLAIELSGDNPYSTVEFSAEASTTTEMNYLERVVKSSVEEGVNVINMPDTVGQKNPTWMKKFYSNIIGWSVGINPDVTVSAHNHNDLDMAAANTWALMEAACEYAAAHQTNINVQSEVTICGIGERAGNTDIFPFLSHLFKFTPSMEAEFSWRFNPELSVATAKDIMKFAHLSVDRQNPIVGEDVNVHRSGVHSNGVIKGGYELYTPFDPQFWGHPEKARHEDGRYQGRRGREEAARAASEKCYNA